jgi:uncharacterized coiled-coil protein SlyX
MVMSDKSQPVVHTPTFEQEAEVLVAYQLDFLAQLERQLRAVHQTMRDIEKLRGQATRVGPQLDDHDRDVTLTHLAKAVADVERNMSTEHDCCAEMQVTIAHMRERLAALRRRVSAGEPPVPAPRGHDRD